MPNDYERYMRRARREFTQGLAATTDQVKEVYRRAASGIRDDITRLTPGTLRYSHLTALQSALDRRAEEMSQEVLAAAHQGIWFSSRTASSGVANATADMVRGVFDERNVQRLFAGINEQATLAMLARTRKDGLKISDRVWRTSENARNNIQRIIEDAVARGQDARTTAKQVDRYLQPGIWKAHKKETRRKLGVGTDVSYQAMRLTRTEMSNAFHEGTIASNQHCPGYRGIHWLLSNRHVIPDICTDMAHNMSHGEAGFYPKGKEPTLPHVQCVVGNTIISGPKVTASTTRWYEGEVIEIETTGGNNLTITPNHPVLTAQGWVVAGLLNEGSYIVCNNREQWNSISFTVSIREPDDYQIPALAKDVACSFGETGNMTSCTVPVTAEQFHGDGVGSKVCVIRTDSLLRDGFNSAFFEPSVELLLMGGDADTFCFYSNGFFAFNFKRFWDSADSSMGSLDIAPTLLRCALGESQAGGFGNVSSVDTRSFEMPFNRSTFDSVSFCEGFFGDTSIIQTNEFAEIGWRPTPLTTRQRKCFVRGTNSDTTAIQKVNDGFTGFNTFPDSQSICRFAGEVSFDKIIRIRRIPRFTGHVYNLQTTKGWFVANNIITHNCLCVAAPAYEEPEQFVERLREWMESPQLQPDIESWYIANRRWLGGRPSVILTQTVLQKALKKAESEIAALEHERAYIIDDKGNILLLKDGSKSRVDFTLDEIKMMQNTILTHNHPSEGGSFSIADVNYAINANLSEIRAVGRKYVHSLKRPQAGWTAWDEVKRDYILTDEEVYRENVHKIQLGLITVDEANREHWHKVMMIITQKHGLIYSRKER